MKLRFGVIVLFCTISLSVFGQSKYSRVKFDLSKVDIQQLNALGLETDHGFLIPGVHFVNDFSDKELSRINAAGIENFVMIDDMQAFYKEQKGKTTKRTAPDCAESPGTLFDYDTPENYTYGSMGGYHTFSELLVILDSMRAKYPNLISARAPIGEIKTWENNEIYWLRVSDNPDMDEDEPEALYTALHHAREPNGLSQMIFYLWHILENYETDPEVKYLVDNTEMYFIPCINPDGYMYNESTNPDGGGLWRKNRRPAQQSDQIGVDLNRNYGYFWGIDDNGSSPIPSRDTYRGPEAFSEPETQAVREFTIDRQIQIALNYHTFGNLLIYPWGYDDSQTPDAAIFNTIGRSMIKENDYLLGSGIETVGYLVNGDSDDYLYGEMAEKDKIFAMTPEVGNTFWPQEEQIDGFNKSCMHQNLVMAHSLLNYYDARIVNLPNVVNEREGVVNLDIRKSGLKEGSVNIQLVSNNELFEFGDFFKTYDLETGEMETIEVSYTISEDAPSFMEISFDLKTDNGELTQTDTYNFTFENSVIETLSTNDASDFSSFENEGTWALTETKFVSGPTSLTDSPDGDYPSWTRNEIKIAEPIDLTGLENATFKFSATWEIEANYDHCLIQASTDGENWTSLCGNYTRNGSENTHGTSDPLLDGTQLNWVIEEIDLEDYLGQSVEIRFVLVSDGFVQLDGIYIDDIIVESKTLVMTSTEETFDDGALNIYPSLSNGRFTVEINNQLQSSGAILEILNANGQLIRTYNNLTNSQSLEVENLSTGIYLVKYTDSGRSLTKKVSVIR